MGLLSDHLKAKAEEWQGHFQRQKKRGDFHIEALEPRLLLNSAPAAAPIPVSDSNHTSEAVVLVQNLLDSIKINFEGWGDQPKDSSPHSSLLDLSNSANNGRKISLHVKADRQVDVKGAADGDYSRQGIEKIVGNEKASIELVAPNVDTVFEITGKDSGVLQARDSAEIEFAGVQSLAGGSGNDTLDYSSYSTSVTVDLSKGTATDTAAVQNVENVIGGAGDDKFTVSAKAESEPATTISGGAGNDTLAVADGSNTWVIEGENSGTLNATSFEGVENLSGGAGDDTFVIAINGQVAGTISGGAGNDTLIGANHDNTWVVTGQNSGKVNDQSFSDIENLVGGNADDIFVFAGGRVTGTVDGAGGNNTVKVTDSLLAIDSEVVVAPAETAPVEAKVELATVDSVAETNVQAVAGAPILDTVDDDSMTVVVNSSDQSAGNSFDDAAPVADSTTDVAVVANAETDSMNPASVPSENSGADENINVSEIDSSSDQHQLLDTLKDVVTLTYAGLFVGVVFEGFEEKLQDRERRNPTQLDKSRAPPDDDDASVSHGLTSDAQDSESTVVIGESSVSGETQQKSVLQASDSSGGSPPSESAQIYLSSGVAGSPTAQLIETLNAANAPPVSPDSSLALTVADSPVYSSSESLTSDDLAPVLAQALQIWIASGLTDDQIQLLNSISVKISDLIGARLGETEGTVITLDLTAAGHGWFADATPADNSEFDTSAGGDRFTAVPGSGAFGRIDLLTVLLHEMGHVLGLTHDSDVDVMHEILRDGERVILDGTLPSFGPAPVDDASTASPDLNLADQSNDNKTISITVNGNGSLNITGTGSSDDGTNVAGITNIIGNANATITLTGPDVANAWTITSELKGSLKPAGLAKITFTNIQILTGGSGDDTFGLLVTSSPFTGSLTIGGGSSGNDSLELVSDQGDITLTDTSLAVGATFTATVSNIDLAKISQGGTGSLTTTGFTGPVFGLPAQPQWVSEGPAPTTGSSGVAGLPNEPVTGAIDSIAAHPYDPNIIYVGTVNGGIWKTENALAGSDGVDNDGDGLIDELDEIKWTPETEQFPYPSIPFLTFDPFDPTNQTLFATNGQISSALKTGRLADPAGVLKTVDGGNSWTLLRDPDVTNKTVYVIVPTRIAGDSANQNVVLAGSEAIRSGATAANFDGGLLRSTDGGASFTKVSGTAVPNGTVTDIEGDPASDQRFYAGVTGAWQQGGINFDPAAVHVTGNTTPSEIDLPSAHGLTGVSGPFRLEPVQVPDVKNKAPDGLVFFDQDYFLRAKTATTFEILDSATATTPVSITGKGEGPFVFTRVLAFTSSDVAVDLTAGAPDPIHIEGHGLTGTSGPFYVIGTKADGTDLPNGLDANRTYYLNATDANHVVVLDAFGGPPIQIASTGGNGATFKFKPVNGLFRTVDGGATWNAINVISPANEAFGASILDIMRQSARIELSVSKVKDASGNIPVYAAFIKATGENKGVVGAILRSNDNGDTWVPMSLPGDGNGGIHLDEQGPIHFSLLADPSDPNIVYVGGDTQIPPSLTGADAPTGRLFRGDFRLARNAPPDSIGTGWVSLVNNDAQGTAPHADSRSLVFDAYGRLLEVDDGGIYALTNALPFLDRTAPNLATLGQVRTAEFVFNSDAYLKFVDNATGVADEIVRIPLPGEFTPAGNWTTDGFRVGQQIVVKGSKSNDGVYTITQIVAPASGDEGKLVLTADVLHSEFETDPAQRGAIAIYGLATLSDAANNTVEFRSLTLSGSPNLQFVHNGNGVGDSIIRSGGDWNADGFAVGVRILVSGTGVNAGRTYTIRAIPNATTLTLDPLTDRVITQSSSAGYSVTSNVIVRAGGASDWVQDGFAIGQRINVSGTGGVNDRSFVIVGIDESKKVLTVSERDSFTVQAAGNNRSVVAAQPNWQSLIGNLNLTELYSVAYSSPGNTLVGGSQDTGVVLQAGIAALTITVKFQLSEDTLEGNLSDTSDDAMVAARFASIDQFAALIKNYPSVIFEVSGYTDSTGDAAANQALSERRAQAVADRIIAQGVDSSRLTVVGYGENRPVSAVAADNRRVEIKPVNVTDTQWAEIPAGSGTGGGDGAIVQEAGSGFYYSTTDFQSFSYAERVANMVGSTATTLTFTPNGGTFSIPTDNPEDRVVDVIKRSDGSWVDDGFVPSTFFSSTTDPIVLSVYFASGVDTLNTANKTLVDAQAVALLKDPSAMVDLSGYADPSSTDVFNQGLSERRAQAVADRLISQGVESYRIKVTGYGEGRQTVGQPDSQQRRVDMRVFSPRTSFIVVSGTQFNDGTYIVSGIGDSTPGDGSNDNRLLFLNIVPAAAATTTVIRPVFSETATVMPRVVISNYVAKDPARVISGTEVGKFTSNVGLDFETPEMSATLLDFLPATATDSARILRSEGSWTDDGFVAGDSIVVSDSASNNGTFTVDHINTAPIPVSMTATADVFFVDSDPSGGTILSDQIIRIGGSWTDDMFFPGQQIHVTGATNASNNGTFTIDSINENSIFTRLSGTGLTFVPGGTTLAPGVTLPTHVSLIVRRDGGNWATNGFRPGMVVEVSNSDFQDFSTGSPVTVNNNGRFAVLGILPGGLTLGADVFGPGSVMLVESPTPLKAGTAVGIKAEVQGTIGAGAAITLSAADNLTTEEAGNTVVVTSEMPAGALLVLSSADRLQSETRAKDVAVRNSGHTVEMSDRATISFATDPTTGFDYIIRSRGSWSADGFVVGAVIYIQGAEAKALNVAGEVITNNRAFTILDINPSDITVGPDIHPTGTVISVKLNSLIIESNAKHVKASASFIHWVGGTFTDKGFFGNQQITISDSLAGLNDRTGTIISVFGDVVNFSNKFKFQGIDTADLLSVFRLDKQTPFDENLQKVQPFVVDADDPRRILIGTGDKNGDPGFLYESRDGGYSFKAILAPKGTLLHQARFADPNSNANLGKIDAMVYGGREPASGDNFTLKPDIAYVGTDGNHSGQMIFVRLDTTSDFKPIVSYTGNPDPNGDGDKSDAIPSGGKVRAIAIDPDDWRKVYVLDQAGVIWFADLTGKTASDLAKRAGQAGAVVWVKFDDLVTLHGARTNFSSIEIVHIGSERVIVVGGKGGVFRKIGSEAWTEFGVGLPNSLVTDIDYVSATDTLVVSTFGRGAWTIPNASRYLAQRPNLRIDGRDGSTLNDVFEILRDPATPWMLDIFLYPSGSTRPSTPSLSIPFANIQDLTLNGRGGDDSFILDYTSGALTSGTQITVDGGDGTDGLQLRGKADQRPTDTTSPFAVFATDPFGDAGGGTILQSNMENTVVNNTTLESEIDVIGHAFPSIGEAFRNAFGLLKGSFFGPLNGNTLDSGFNSSQGEAAGGEGGSGEANAGNSLGSEDLVDSDGQVDIAGSIFERLIQEGLGAFNIAQIATGGQVSDLTALEQALENLDDVADNVSLNGSTLTVHIVKDLDAFVDLNINQDTALGEVRINGRVKIEAKVELNLVFGVDEFGLFITPDDPVSGVPELKISHISVAGDVQGEGRLGFLGVELKAAQFELDPDAQIAFNLVDPDGDGVIRVSELSPSNIDDLFNVDIKGDTDSQDDFVLRGTFGVKAVLPGTESSIDIADAEVSLIWHNIEQPTNMTVSAGLTPDPSFIDFLKVSSDGVLTALQTLSTQLQSLFGSNIPFVSDNLSQLIALTQAFQTKVLGPISDPVSGSISLPTLQDLAVQLASSLGVDLESLGLHYGLNSATGSHELTYNLTLSDSFLVDKSFDFGFASTDGPAEVRAGFHLAVQIGIDVDRLLNGDSPQHFFFIRNVQLNGEALLAPTTIIPAGPIGPVTITPGMVSGNIAASITLDDSATSRIFIDDLVADPLSFIGTADVSGNVLVTGASLKIADTVFVSGDFSIEAVTGDLMLSDGTLRSGVDYLVVSASHVNAFFGVNGPYVDPTSSPDAFGLSLTDIDFSMIRFSDTSGLAPVEYTALKTSGGSATFVGLPDLTLGLYSFAVNLNQTSDSSNSGLVLDLNPGGSYVGITVTPLAGPVLDFEGDQGSLLNVSGHAVIDAFGVLVAKGGFSLSIGSVSGNDNAGTDPDVTVTNADAVAISFTTADVWVGVGGNLDDHASPNNFSDDVIQNGTLGFRATVDALTVVSIKDPGSVLPNDETSYLGVAIDNFTGDLIGMEDVLTFHAWNVDVLVNRATDNNPATLTAPAKLDWSKFTNSGLNISTVKAALNATSLGALTDSVDLSAKGNVALNALNGTLVA